MPQIAQAKILIMSTDGFEQSELMVPLEKLRAAGATVHVAAPEAGVISGWDQEDWGQDIQVDHTLDQVHAEDYDAIVLPGGQMNPDKLRLNGRAIELIKAFHASGKVVAAICHAPWLLVEAGLVKGKRVTSYQSIRTDLVNAGGEWEDEAVVTDKGMITSRKPADLDAFVDKIIEEVEEGLHRRTAHQEGFAQMGGAL